ncbi:hypothetical protein K7432_001430 [Basidiobolus ranarum]|uniref:Uncharacterized protein n=1 Tax=Basidiobolus ranarum TaxID=34480 RepID=A0ABR2W9N6_9FUNG
MPDSASYFIPLMVTVMTPPVAVFDRDTPPRLIKSDSESGARSKGVLVRLEGTISRAIID